MHGTEVAVIRTGTANIASVLAALARLGAKATLTIDADDVQRFGHVILPGVGAFAAAMQPLRSHGLADAITRRVLGGRPTLAICLGLQLLCKSSDESPGVEGLGVVPATVGRFPDGVRVPQLGWNKVQPDAGCKLLTTGYAYFANSYRIEHTPEAWLAGTSEHGGRFVAALERGSVLACQFHPELSGNWGLGLLERWLETSDEPGGE
jgi:glutamine amidotransferase